MLPARSGSTAPGLLLGARSESDLLRLLSVSKRGRKTGLAHRSRQTRSETSISRHVLAKSFAFSSSAEGRPVTRNADGGERLKNGLAFGACEQQERQQQPKAVPGLFESVGFPAGSE
jgi:hypothetical protein